MFNTSPLVPLRLCYLLPLFILSCSLTPEVKTVKTSKTAIEATVSSVNSGMVRSEKIAELAFGAVGRVKNINVKLGDIVEKDFLISEIENGDTIATLSATTRELNRQITLSGKGLSSPSMIDQARNAHDVAVTAYEKTRIVAPFRGLIAELNLEVGQLSQITAEFKRALIRLVDLEPRYVRAEIDEVDLPRLKVNQAARVKILAIRKQPFSGTVRKVVQFVSSAREQDRTSEIEITIDSPELLPVGASADVEVIVEAKSDVLTVPVRCILNKGNKRIVYRLVDGYAKESVVELGILNYDVAEILSGLALNDEVIISNDSLDLVDGLKVKAAS